MSFDDFAFKLLRKSLSPGLYASLSGSIFGRKKNYERPETYRSISDFYFGKKIPLQGKILVEVGSGNQFYTAFHFLEAGCDQVLLVDPKITFDSFAEQTARFRAGNPDSPDPETFRGRIECYHALDQVPERYNGTVGAVYSHLVLEHVRDLDAFFLGVRRLLAADGISYNLVDLSDHTYHVLDKFRLTRAFAHSRLLKHLEYSPRTFDFLNDRKCYMNRYLLPRYLAGAESAGLLAEVTVRHPFREVPIHADLLRAYPGARPEDLYISGFELRLTKNLSRT